MLTTLVRIAGASFLMLMATAQAHGEAPRFGLPIDCTPGRDCFVQNYVDTDPGSGARDYACGKATYDGHTGTDIRVRSVAAAEGVTVRAAAAGTVLRMRDGIADKLAESEADRQSVLPIGLGNTVILDHGDGWHTAYGHMRKGSILVRSGDRVVAGQALGEVGISGLTQFAHLHFEVRFKGEVLDPFLGTVVKGECLRQGDPAALAGRSVWAKAIADQLLFRGASMFDAGFAGKPPQAIDLERGGTSLVPATANAEALIFYVRIMHVEPGDRIMMTLTGPGGPIAETPGDLIPRHRAMHMVYVGKRIRASEPLASGRYVGTATLLRDGKPIATRTESFEVNP